MEVVWSAGDGAVKRIEERRVEGAEGELVDYVGEVERYSLG